MKLLGAILCVAIGVWLTHNHPDLANTLLVNVQFGINWVIAFLQGLSK